MFNNTHHVVYVKLNSFYMHSLSLSENTKFNIASQIIHIGFIFNPLNVGSISFFKCFQINNDEMKCIFNSLLNKMKELNWKSTLIHTVI